MTPVSLRASQPDAGTPASPLRPGGPVLHHVVTTCRACGHGPLTDVHAFGPVPLANALRTGAQLEEPELRFPLTLALCTACTLVQLRETVDPELLFQHYRYFSSFSTSTLAYADELAERLIARGGLSATSRVVEIASNDGYLLAPFQRRGVPVLGIEPAQNVAAVAVERGVPTLAEFFTAELAAQLAADSGPCELLLANNVLAHVADLNGFVAGIRTMLGNVGTAVLEVPYLGDLLAEGQWDTIYHEHLCYFSLRALQQLFARHWLAVVDVERLPRHGGSLRLFVTARRDVPRDARVDALLASEARLRLHEPDAYRSLSDAMGQTRTALQHALLALRGGGGTVAAYGASAKGSTLMHVCGIRREQLAFVADRSPHKHGHFTPGNHVPIVPTSTILERQPTALLLLTWNFVDEILAQEGEYRRRGGQFLVPAPTVHFR